MYLNHKAKQQLIKRKYGRWERIDRARFIIRNGGKELSVIVLNFPFRASVKGNQGGRASTEEYTVQLHSHSHSHSHTI